MTVIAIAAVLMLVVVPIGQSWVASHQVNNAVNNLRHATLLAKSSALRNTQNKPMNEVAVSMCYYKGSSTLQVVFGSCPAAPTTNASLIVQQYSMAKDINISVNTDEFTCLSFDSAGVLTDTGTCAEDTTAFLVFKKVGGNILDEDEIDVI